MSQELIEKLYSLYLASSGVTTDTRNINQGNIFFALKGENFNANLFAEEALTKGAAYVVVDEISNPEWETKFGERLILVDAVLKTLQRLAGHHRAQLNCPVLAITGSNGKTTTKELIAAVLSKKFKTYATKGNLNNHIGIPLTLLSIKSDVEFAVIEMGANHQGEIASYCEYVKPDYGLITNVGLAHIEGFGGFEGVVKGKTELYKDIALRGGKVFINCDTQLLIDELQITNYPPHDIISYGTNANAFCKGEVGGSKEFLSVLIEGEAIQANLVGEYNFENVMSAVCVGKYFGVETTQIKEAIENYKPTNNRSQKISLGSNTIFLDAYNANPSSMLEALKNFEKIEAKNKVVVLGQMMELGKYSEEEHQKIVAALSSSRWQKVKKVFVGKEFKFLKTDSSVLWFEKTEEVKDWFKQQQFENSYVLIKGSRKNELEKILKD
ncbi:MAG: UDP-N-acetylmuramoyl-tripeptide--D-alanyl-D-alanine ligase [Bacteroidetes bacterium]|nr:UDP-N-acetylmuramoyl-tripeptide--D-alanyl-D-alanine ligase [Bacteroidota bacterium]